MEGGGWTDRTGHGQLAGGLLGGQVVAEHVDGGLTTRDDVVRVTRASETGQLGGEGDGEHVGIERVRPRLLLDIFLGW
jgi:hypothetical protein